MTDKKDNVYKHDKSLKLFLILFTVQSMLHQLKTILKWII